MLLAFGHRDLQERILARLEAQALLGALARRVDAIEFAGPPRRHLNNTLRALESLPVRFRLV